MTYKSSQFLKQTVSLTLAVALVGFFGFSLLEPATSSAQSESDSTDFTASLTVDEELTITGGNDITMSPNLGIDTDVSIGSTTITVETNADAGYTMTIQATGSPAMVGTNNDDQFADYSPSTSNTPEQWSVSGAKEFGYGAHSGDALSDFDSGTGCGTASDPSADGTHFEGFNGPNPEDIASNSGTTADGGDTTTFCVAAEQNNVEAEEGNYVANLTATATAN